MELCGVFEFSKPKVSQLCLLYQLPIYAFIKRAPNFIVVSIMLKINMAKLQSCNITFLVCICCINEE